MRHWLASGLGTIREAPRLGRRRGVIFERAPFCRWLARAEERAQGTLVGQLRGAKVQAAAADGLRARLLDNVLGQSYRIEGVKRQRRSRPQTERPWLITRAFALVVGWAKTASSVSPDRGHHPPRLSPRKCRRCVGWALTPRKRGLPASTKVDARPKAPQPALLVPGCPGTSAHWSRVIRWRDCA